MTSRKYIISSLEEKFHTGQAAMECPIYYIKTNHCNMRGALFIM